MVVLNRAETGQTSNKTSDKTSPLLSLTATMDSNLYMTAFLGQDGGGD